MHGPKFRNNKALYCKEEPAKGRACKNSRLAAQVASMVSCTFKLTGSLFGGIGGEQRGQRLLRVLS